MKNGRKNSRLGCRTGGKVRVRTLSSLCFLSLWLVGCMGTPAARASMHEAWGALLNAGMVFLKDEASVVGHYIADNAQYWQRHP